MGGYGAPQGVAQGTHDDLCARVLVLSDGATQIALAVLDLVAVTPDIVSAVRDIVHSECQIPPDHVCVTATHTHSGPGPLRHKDGGPFVAETARRVAGAVKAAQQGRRDVT